LPVNQFTGSDLQDVQLIKLEKSMTLTNSSAHRTTLAAAKQIIIDIDFPTNFVSAKNTLGRSFFYSFVDGTCPHAKEKVCTEQERDKKKDRL
jgi:hypothetical protein